MYCVGKANECLLWVKLTVVADVGILAFIIWWLKKEMIIKCDSKFGCFVLVLDAGKMICKQTHHLEQSHETYHCGG
jgi:hypothetical protein